MKRVDSVSFDSDRGKLTGKGMIFPSFISEQSDLERFEESHDASDAKEVQRWLKLCNLLKDRCAICFLTDFPDI